MKIYLTLFFNIVLLIVNLYTTRASAWGGRGHDTICQAAVFLLKEEGLKHYLQNRPNTMGYLCNVPDISWRSLPSNLTQLGNPTHFIDPEVIGLKLTETPQEYKKIIEEYTGKENKFKPGTIRSIPREFGSIWWRTLQFLNRSFELEAQLKIANSPSNTKDEQNEELPYNKAILNFIVNLGVMGHFVGDASQPLHNTADYDGYNAGHGGLHSFYEDTAVGFIDGELLSKVLKEAKKIKSPGFLKKDLTYFEKIRTLSESSLKEIPMLYKLDKVKASSIQKVDDKGVETRIPAEREYSKKSTQGFEPIIVGQFARSALLLAHFWDEAYAKTGKPAFSNYKSYKFPHNPEFVAPDYH